MYEYYDLRPVYGTSLTLVQEGCLQVKLQMWLPLIKLLDNLALTEIIHGGAGNFLHATVLKYAGTYLSDVRLTGW